MLRVESQNMRIFGNRRRLTDERRSSSAVQRSTQPHPLFSDALDHLPNARWAVACVAEFRTEGRDGLRGILHHDGALLCFTTWGGAERFVGAPMEFLWHQTADGTFHITGRDATVRFCRLAPLSSFVQHPPPFAAAEDQPLAESLAGWMATWAPPQVSPLASPM